ncbi:hypothetical protein T11_4016 [Trichinella zimbabwensis]|uniref:UPF0033 domain-containing protein n=1 Tax=Trichinella zimbabwensis TaxID=268475 RepID=A0A0V1G7U7_9BILA|nr:hypothetical protein T11_4016 [Trichinella zimbabwensis]
MINYCVVESLTPNCPLPVFSKYLEKYASRSGAVTFIVFRTLFRID